MLSVLDSGLNEFGCNDDTTFTPGDCPAKSGQNYCSQGAFTATLGQTYYFLVGGYDSDTDGGQTRLELMRD